ncbi:MAG: tetratricopeptide repeat protein [Candidatus Solibacter usitatus]|nr:tetratricopeptide repeat protein [Candidatus Solibacter usitatus]
MPMLPARVISMPSRELEPAVTVPTAPPAWLKLDGTARRQADTEVEAPALLGKAGEAWEAGDREQAAALCAEAVRADPAAWEPRYNEALLLEDRGQVEESITGLKYACALAPDEAAPALRLAYLLEGTGRDAEAGFWYGRALALDGSQTAGWLRLGLLEMRKSRWQAALPCLKKAAEREPAAGYPLGLCHAMIGQLEEAVDALRRAPQDDPQVLTALAALALEGGDLEAAEQFERVLRAVGDVPAELSYRLALVWQDRGEEEAARTHYRRAVQGEPALASGYFALQSHS